jgi:hypothetical protein
MIRFDVVKETHGWSIRMGERMTTPFWSKEQAVRQAKVLAEAIRRHGELTEVVVEGGANDDEANAEERSFSGDEPLRRPVRGLRVAHPLRSA